MELTLFSRSAWALFGEVSEVWSFVEQLIKGESVLIDSFCNEDNYVPDEIFYGGLNASSMVFSNF